VPDPLAADALELVDAAAAAEVLDDDPPAAALDDVVEVDPHPASTAAIIATTVAPAPMRARLDLNMGRLPPLVTARVPVRVEPSPAREANRFDPLAASRRR
jgi:hypothetical protein